MWLKSLHVENFRGFEKLDVTFDEHVTLLIGGNGAGKTAALDAVAFAVSPGFAELTQNAQVYIEPSDIRRISFEHGDPPTRDLQPQTPLVIGATATLPGSASEFNWNIEPLYGVGRGPEEPGPGSEALVAAFRGLGREVRNGARIDLPVLAHYGVQRLRREPPQSLARAGNRFEAFEEWFDIAASGKRLFEWLRSKTAEEVQEWQTDPGYRHPQLRAVFAAITSCIEDVSDLRFVLKHNAFRLVVGDRYQSFDMLSAGYQNLLALVADVARRAAILNPHHGEQAARESAGLVLIDEIDLHLHPKWQRTVIPSLRHTFPKMQFIATTHSPQVLASVQRDQVRIFDNNQLVDAAPFVEGRASNELLQDVFDVSARPEATERELDELFHLLDTEDYVAAQAKFSALVGRLGPDDAAMVRARWILDTEGGVKHVAPIAS